MQDGYPGLKAGVFYRLLLRSSLFSTETIMGTPSFFNQPASRVILILTNDQKY